MHDQCQKGGCNFKQADMQSIIGCVQWVNIISKGDMKKFWIFELWSQEIPQKILCTAIWQWFVFTWREKIWRNLNLMMAFWGQKSSVPGGPDWC
jgi:hypothetical protein